MWPFAKPQLEQRASYSDAAVQAILESASGDGPANWQETAVAQTAAGLIARSLSLATVEGAPASRTGLTPEFLYSLGHALVMGGELVAAIGVDPGGTVRLTRASNHDISGGADPASWRYRCTLPGPTRNDQQVLPAEGVCHFRLNPSASEPHRGRSPIALARQSAKLAAGLERQLAGEANAQSGTLIPSPDPDEKQLAGVKAALAKLAGKNLLVPSMAKGWNTGTGGAPATADWKPMRLGFSAPDSALAARTAVEKGILSACGIPVTLFDSASQTAAREGLRMFLHSGLQPIADLIAGECRAKLMAEISFAFDRLFASDIQSRARSYAALVGAGMDKGEAAKATGMADA